ncbi:Uncharacterized protein QTN25_003014 [Entamoeba marina]
MSPVDPPTTYEKLTYWFTLTKVKLVNFISKYLDVDDLYKSDYLVIARRITLSSIPFSFFFGFISLFFFGYSQIAGGVAIVSAILTYVIEKPVECEGVMIKKMSDARFKMFFFIICGVVMSLSIWTVFGGVIEMAGGLFYVYLFYTGELSRAEEFVIRVSEYDIEKLDGILTQEEEE